jgi:hypothetical protein
VWLEDESELWTCAISSACHMLVREGTVAAFSYLEEIFTVFLSKVLYYSVTLSFLDITCISQRKRNSRQQK